jgi:hypothetical protein
MFCEAETYFSYEPISNLFKLNIVLKWVLASADNREVSEHNGNANTNAYDGVAVKYHSRKYHPGLPGLLRHSGKLRVLPQDTWLRERVENNTIRAIDIWQ